MGEARRDLLDVVRDQDSAGAYGSSASAPSRRTRSSRPPRSRPAAGSSSSSSSGSAMSARAIWTRLRSPSDSVPNVRSARWATPSCSSRSVGAVLVGAFVLLAPAPGDGPGPGDDDVADALVRREPLGEGCRGQADPRPDLEHVDPTQASRRGRGHDTAGTGRGRSTRPGAAWSCRRRSGPRTTQRSPSSTAQSTASRIGAPPRTTVTPRRSRTSAVTRANLRQ